jgi:hypothetical protein
MFWVEWWFLRLVALAYCVNALECYLGVGLFVKVGNVPNFGALVCEAGPIFILIVFDWLFVVHFCF